MLTHVGLLRGVNVGGRNKLAMADLRAVATSIGWEDVQTYVQSGNVVFGTKETDCSALADRLEGAVELRLGLRAPVIVLGRSDLAQVIADNPFPHESDPRHLHAIFRRGDLTGKELAIVDRAQRRSSDKNSDDQVIVVGKTLFLRTPQGLGRSELAAQLTRSAGLEAGTARNWSTVTRLMSLIED